jgi:hypothetical protein
MTTLVAGFLVDSISSTYDLDLATIQDTILSSPIPIVSLRFHSWTTSVPLHSSESSSVLQSQYMPKLIPQLLLTITVHTPLQQQYHRSAVPANAANPSPPIHDQNVPTSIMASLNELHNITDIIPLRPALLLRISSSVPVIDSHSRSNPSRFR